MKEKLTIIIVTYNSSEIITSCLEKINFSKHKVIVVDNASSDNTLELVSKNFPQAEIIKSDKNIGYGRGNNLALKKVETEYALILNPDAFIFDEDIEKALQELDSNPEIALLGPVILDAFPPQNEEILTKISRARLIKNSNNQNNLLEVSFLSGAVLFMKSKIFQKIGFFDENFFLFYEDNEICFRTIKNGYKIALFTHCFAFHGQGKSSTFEKKTKSNRFIGWHLKGWSKFYFYSITKNSLIAKLMALLSLFQYCFKICFLTTTGNISRVHLYLGGFRGAAAFIFGLKAFKKDGSPNESPRG